MKNDDYINAIAEFNIERIKSNAIVSEKIREGMRVDYDIMQIEKNSELLRFILEARAIIFTPGGKFIGPLKIHQIVRIYRLAKLAYKLINKIIEIYKNRKYGK